MNPTPILIAFVTGLTTGGLSCFAVQGGLLTSSIASYAERRPSRDKRVAQPILLFLTSKLIVHTFFGFLLGWVGTTISPSPVARGVLQLAVGIFMVGNALRMLDVHPFFRVFSFEPPRSVTRLIRKKAKGRNSWSTPVWLGALTLLIPCGITQIVMATAVSIGSPWMGAALLFAFVLGASPTFFSVTYLAARLSAMFEKHFLRVLAVVILLLGLFSIETGLNLAGSPVSLTRGLAFLRGEQLATQAVPLATSASSGLAIPQPLIDGLATPDSNDVQLGEQTDLKINVRNNGYSPRTVYAPAGKTLRLILVTKGVYSCSRAFVIPDLNFQKLLPDTGEIHIDIPAQNPGTVLPFMCSMGMYTGQIIFQ